MTYYTMGNPDRTRRCALVIDPSRWLPPDREPRAGAAPVEERFWDGKWTRETRAASFGSDGCRTETSVTESSDYPTVTNSVTRYDFLGRVACVQTPAFGGGWLAVSNFYDGASSRLLRVIRTGQPGTLYAYDELGSLAATALDADGDGQIDYAGDDRISATATRHEPINGDWWRVTTQSVWHEAGVDACLTTGVSRVRLTGLGGWDDTYGGNLTARSETLDARSNVMRSSTYTDTAMPSSWQVLERPDSIQPALSYSVAGRPVLAVTATAVTNSYAYDGFARRIVFIDGRGNATLTHYNALGQEQYTENAAGNRTTYGYDALGRRTSEADALTNTVHKACDSLGNTVSVWGAAYPVEQGYDTQGRKVLMKTFRDEQGAGDETRWLYDNATGLLTNKVYADGKGPAYTYTPDGNLATRTWARGVTTSYDYDDAGALTSIGYSDDTPGMVFQYDRMGRQVLAVTDGVSTNLYGYSLYGQLTNETVTLCAAPLRETITRTYDSLGRESGLSLGSDYGVVYKFDDFGRFHSVSSTVASAKSDATYGYLAGSDLVAAMTNSWGFSWKRTFEANRDLIAAVENRCGASYISRFDYDNDPLARRTRRIDNLNVTNNFGYNGRSEVIGAAMGTNTFSYAYDPIGNRLTATNNQEGWVYQANPLNQYTNILEGAAPSAPLYDLDGNMTAAGDGWWYAWNGENRMVLASNAQHVVTYAYDHQGRMVAKTVDDVARQYIWDGYNIVAGVGTTATNWFVWGLDLSGTLQGAGGVGGLLAEVKDGVPYFAAFDVNGNVTEHVATNGTIVAHYEYSPFGEIALQSGDLADSFTHRFSTKPWCGVTGLIEYEKRKYEPGMGRWLNRDPIGERGSRSLYEYCANGPISCFDILGLTVVDLDMGVMQLEDPKDSSLKDFFTINVRIIQKPTKPTCYVNILQIRNVGGWLLDYQGGGKQPPGPWYYKESMAKEQAVGGSLLFADKPDAGTSFYTMVVEVCVKCALRSNTIEVEQEAKVLVTRYWKSLSLNKYQYDGTDGLIIQSGSDPLKLTQTELEQKVNELVGSKEWLVEFIGYGKVTVGF